MQLKFLGSEDITVFMEYLNKRSPGWKFFKTTKKILSFMHILLYILVNQGLEDRIVIIKDSSLSLSPNDAKGSSIKINASSYTCMTFIIAFSRLLRKASI